MPAANFGPYHVRKWFTLVEDTQANESGQPAFLTQVFADPVRESVGGGKAWVPSTGKVAGPGVVIDIPLAHKHALFVRSHYDTVSVSFGDAPRGDEVVIAFAFATRGRLKARLGGLAAQDITGTDGLR